jgi:hypothetical protein
VVGPGVVMSAGCCSCRCLLPCCHTMPSRSTYLQGYRAEHVHRRVKHRVQCVWRLQNAHVPGVMHAARCGRTDNGTQQASKHTPINLDHLTNRLIFIKPGYQTRTQT